MEQRVPSSGSAGSSTEGAENTVAIAGGIALISIAAASSILLLVSKNAPQIQTVDYSGPSLSYFINKFKPPEIVQASVPTETESPSPVQSENPPTQEISQIQVQSEYSLEPSARV